MTPSSRQLFVLPVLGIMGFYTLMGPDAQAAQAAPEFGLKQQCEAGDATACVTQCASATQVCVDGKKSACDDLASTISDCPSTGALPLGQICAMPTTDIRPTQGAVGMVAAQCKATKIASKKPSSLRAYLLARPVPTIAGPDGRYISDRHHLSTAVHIAGIDSARKKVFACGAADRSTDSMGDFWGYMVANNNAWLRDRTGREITAQDLPSNLSVIADDPYRSLSRWVRDSCGYIKCGKQCGGDGANTSDLLMCQRDSVSPYFLEFHWANDLRVEVAIDGIYDMTGVDQARALQARLDDAMERARQQKSIDEGLPGWNGALIKPKLVSFDPDTACEL